MPPRTASARDNAALILASLSESSQPVQDVLKTMMADGRPWHVASGAIAFAKLRDGDAWKRIKQGLDDPTTRYAFAALLAHDGLPPLRSLAKSFGDGARLDAITQSMNTAIAGHLPRNCYEQRYDRWLAERIDARPRAQCLNGDCSKSPQAPIGGDCTLSGS